MLELRQLWGTERLSNSHKVKQPRRSTFTAYPPSHWTIPPGEPTEQSDTSTNADLRHTCHHCHGF